VLFVWFGIAKLTGLGGSSLRKRNAATFYHVTRTSVVIF
jgi:hypothetical protein